MNSILVASILMSRKECSFSHSTNTDYLLRLVVPQTPEENGYDPVLQGFIFQWVQKRDSPTLLKDLQKPYTCDDYLVSARYA